MINDPHKDDHTQPGGEDEASTEREGDDRHLHEDQKAPSFPADS